ncbi:MAG TPA: GNAT family N-acetyltransferase [Nakamurella sp.]
MNIRLRALRESPESFLSTFERETSYGEEQWRAECARGEWNIGFVGAEEVSLLGATRELGTPVNQCYLEYLWVAPSCRRSGLARQILGVVLDRLKTAGVRTVFLWVLDGNEGAAQLYKRIGFVSTNHRQPLEADPGRSEERMRLNLG